MKIEEAGALFREQGAESCLVVTRNGSQRFSEIATLASKEKATIPSQRGESIKFVVRFPDKKQQALTAYELWESLKKLQEG